MALINGAQGGNVFFVVGASATLGTDTATSLPSTMIDPRSRSYSSVRTRVLLGFSRSFSARTTWM